MPYQYRINTITWTWTWTHSSRYTGFDDDFIDHPIGHNRFIKQSDKTNNTLKALQIQSGIRTELNVRKIKIWEKNSNSQPAKWTRGTKITVELLSLSFAHTELADSESKKKNGWLLPLSIYAACFGMCMCMSYVINFRKWHFEPHVHKLINAKATVEFVASNNKNENRCHRGGGVCRDCSTVAVSDCDWKSYLRKFLHTFRKN